MPYSFLYPQYALPAPNPYEAHWEGGVRVRMLETRRGAHGMSVWQFHEGHEYSLPRGLASSFLKRKWAEVCHA